MNWRTVGAVQLNTLLKPFGIDGEGWVGSTGTALTGTTGRVTGVVCTGVAGVISGVTWGVAGAACVPAEVGVGRLGRPPRSMMTW
jgi:hypothetical protein